MRSPSGTPSEKSKTTRAGFGREGPPLAGTRQKCSDSKRSKATPWIWLNVGLLALVVVLLVFVSGCGSTWKGSVGAVLGKDNRTGRVYVRDVPQGMGAEKAGILVEDEVTAIDGTPVAKMSPEEVHGALAGAVGSKVTLTLLRRGALVTVVVERGPLRVEEKK